MTTMLGWLNKDIPAWMEQIDRFDKVCQEIRNIMSWS